MRAIDELHLNYPFAGARMLRDMLKLDGLEVGRKHVRTLMEKMGIAALYRKRNTSAPHPAHPVYRYLLKNLTINRPNQVWATDITYIPMKRGFVFLVAILDWATRKVLAHRVSISMTTDFCIEALEEAIAKYGTPDIFNTDQGSQFTSEDFTHVLKDHHVKISMDGKGRWVDNVFVERLWKSVKYEHVYLHAYHSVSEAKQQLASYFEFYNARRPHSSLGGQTPDTAYGGSGAWNIAA
jgi:putative transposase